MFSYLYLLFSNTIFLSEFNFFPVNSNIDELVEGGTFLYKKYIYFHEMNPEHACKLAMNCKTKHLYRHQFAEAHFVNAAIYIDITSRMFYVFKDLHRHPHGSDNRSEKDMAISTLNFVGRLAEGDRDVVKQIPLP